MTWSSLWKTPAARVPRCPEGTPGIVELPDPDEVVIPLEYPGQILFRPLVQAGDQVARYQPIGRSERGNVVHASIGGRVQEIRAVWTARSFHVPAVVIRRGAVADLTPAEVLVRCGLESGTASRIDAMRACGVISPWTTPGRNHCESDPGEFPDVRHLVIEGFHEEPTICGFEQLLLANAEALRDGLPRLTDLAPQARIWLTVRRPLKAWAHKVFGAAVTVVGVPDDYRRRLARPRISRLTGIPIPRTAAYRQHGVAVLPTEFALAALDAMHGRCFVRKTVTLAGRPFARPLTVRAPLGITVRQILASQGVDAAQFGRVVMGGPMMGHALYTDETPLSKFQHGVFLLGRDELPAEVNLACVNCGRCTRACPARLQVHLLARYVEYDQLGDACRFHPEACLECGLCAFVCPARRPLVQLVKMAKRYGGVAA
ncbi:MAG TPA: 4Fe-4S dicluster domain-containing protein [Candidatus Krumholzibacteria bacterium]|nr:4Fe-4S dicluster domain-containing protein [Candidatus Krumholzibacteria bacterium]HPD72651.1 4Fe-4S dicluster domain-containing protein [Candidatus Krumholzibacteria bacterium]HRY40417.1 4Fe-4S dicluster domain-containing protein [Candidatus Krumholzibacteria bacterium]